MINKIVARIQSNPFWNKLFRNMFSATMGEVGSAGLTVLTTIFMVWAIGDTAYSTFVLAQSYMCIVDGIVNFQSWAAVIKFGAERIAQHDDRGLEAIIKIGTIVDITTAVTGMVVALVLAPVVGSILGWNEQLVVCATFFSFEIIFHFSGTSVGVLRLLNHFKLVAIQRVLVALFKLVAVVLFFTFGVVDLFSYVVVCTIADIIGHIILTCMSILMIRKNRTISIKGIIKAPIKEFNKRFWRFAVWSNLGMSVDIPVKQFDVFIMSIIDYDMVAVFKIYKLIGNILVELSVPISQSIMPQFSELVAKGRLKECYEVMRKLHKSIILVMIPCTAIVTIVSPWILNAIFGELYGRYFYILSIYLLIRSYALSYTAVHQLFTSMGFVKEDFFITCASNIAYLIIALLLSNSLGIFGIVLAIGVQIVMCINIKKSILKKRIMYNSTV